MDRRNRAVAANEVEEEDGGVDEHGFGVELDELVDKRDLELDNDDAVEEEADPCVARAIELDGLDGGERNPDADELEDERDPSVEHDDEIDGAESNPDEDELEDELEDEQDPEFEHDDLDGADRNPDEDEDELEDDDDEEGSVEEQDGLEDEIRGGGGCNHADGGGWVGRPSSGA